MKKYDVIIVGAGPAGATAAKKMAEGGLDVVMIEEHTVAGLPSHCWGLLHAVTKPEFYEEILDTMPANIILGKYHTVRVFSPSGKVLSEVPMTGGEYLVRRDAFDRELVKQAINAGANLMLNIRVISLIKQNGKIVGVTTNSEKLPEIYGKLVIGADGIHANQKGIAKWEGFTKDKVDKTFTAGVTLELARVKNIDVEVKELHYGSFSKRGWVGICPIDNKSCMTDFMSIADFERIKKQDYALSEKIRDAVPVSMTGWSHSSDLGVGLPGVIADGLILAGSGANIMGIVNAVITGRYAADMAIESIRENDITIKKLGKYEDLLRTRANPHGFIKKVPFFNQSDETIEDLLIELIRKDEFVPVKPIPL